MALFLITIITVQLLVLLELSKLVIFFKVFKVSFVKRRFQTFVGVGIFDLNLSCDALLIFPFEHL